MKVNLMKKVPLAMVSFAISGSAFALDMDGRVTQLEQQMKQVRVETASGTYGAQTAPARAEVNGQGVYVNFDVLYWHAKVGGTQFAYSDSDPVGALPIEGNNGEVGFDWDWGFKAGLGYNFTHDSWDLGLEYTYFETSDTSTVNGGLNSSVVPLKGSTNITGGSFTSCNQAKSNYSLDNQSLDLSLGRSYYISKRVSFRPSFGLRSLWLNQKQTTRYTGGEILSVNNVEIKDKNDFWGMGPRTALESKWHIGNGFSIFGNAGAALLYGRFRVKHKEEYSLTPATDSIQISANMHRFTPAAQLVLGLVYDKYVYDNKQHVSISLGYDCQYLWNQNQMIQVTDTTTSAPASVIRYNRAADDVSIYGITGNFRWDF